MAKPKEPTERQCEEKYQQSQFCREAQKSINRTLAYINRKSSMQFCALHIAIVDKTYDFLIKNGIYDKDRNVIKGTKEQACKLFDTYYEIFLKKEQNKNSSSHVISYLGDASNG